MTQLPFPENIIHFHSETKIRSNKMSTGAVNWPELPPELLETIAGKLSLYIDYLRFRAVCLNWKSSIPKTPNHLPHQLPWLMLPKSHNRHHHHHRGFYSLSENKVHFLKLPQSSHSKRRCGSSHGWLIIVDETPEISAVNPLTGAKIDLPKLTTFPNVIGFDFADVGSEYKLRSFSGEIYTSDLKEMRDCFFKKVILSASPAKDLDYVAVAILSRTGDLAFCRKGDQCWRFIEDAESYCEDVIYSNGLIYAVNKIGTVAICDVSGCLPRVSIVAPEPQIGGDMQYLVNSGDEILMITRFLDFDDDDEIDLIGVVYKTIRFDVFKLDFSETRWVDMERLGDRIVFVGENSSLCLLASDFVGCKGNCIYFTDDYSETNYGGVLGGHDLGIFNLGDGSVEPLPCYPPNSNLQSHWPPPLWVTPNPC